MLWYVSSLFRLKLNENSRFAVGGWHGGLNITQVVLKAYPWISNVIIVGNFPGSVTVAYVGYVRDSENGRRKLLVSVTMASVWYARDSGNGRRKLLVSLTMASVWYARDSGNDRQRASICHTGRGQPWSTMLSLHVQQDHSCDWI
jgi:hypothetical protein